jgi:hypothetical protein
MPKAGKYDYPFFDLGSCIEKLRELHSITKIDENKRELVAETLKMSMTGGGFAYLMSAMDKYGLVKTGGGNVTITTLGKTILYGDPAEVEQAKKKAVSSIDLFRELFEQYGKDIQIEQIKAFLRQKADVDISKAQKMAENVDTIYKKVSNYITVADKLGRLPKEQAHESSRFGRREPPTTEEGKPDLLKIQYGSLYIEVPKEDAETALKLVAEKLGIKLTVEKTAQ